MFPMDMAWNTCLACSYLAIAIFRWMRQAGVHQKSFNLKKCQLAGDRFSLVFRLVNEQELFWFLLLLVLYTSPRLQLPPPPVYGRLAHTDDPLQVSAGWPAPTIGSIELCILQKTCNFHLYHMYHQYSSSCRIPSMISLILCIVFRKYAVVTCNCDILCTCLSVFTHFSWLFTAETKSCK